MLSFLLTNVLRDNVLLPRGADDERGGLPLSRQRRRRQIDSKRGGEVAVLVTCRLARL